MCRCPTFQQLLLIMTIFSLCLALLFGVFAVSADTHDQKMKAFDMVGFGFVLYAASHGVYGIAALFCQTHESFLARNFKKIALTLIAIFFCVMVLGANSH